MSGILEQILGGIQQVLQNQQVILQAVQALSAIDRSPAPAQTASTLGSGGGVLGGLNLAMAGPSGLSLAPATPAAPAVPANVTGDQIMALITPHLDNAAVKDALSMAMKNCGVNALPEAQPAQYPALYAAFQQVIAQYGAQAAVSQSNTAII